MIRELKVLFLLLLCFPAVAVAAEPQEVPGGAGAVLDEAKTSLIEINAEFERDLRRYLYLNISDADYKLPPYEKMKRGDFFFKKGDYATSAGIFYSVTESVHENDPVKSEALYKLGESLFMQKNYISATRYYEMLAASYNSGLKVKALKRLIFMSYSLGEYAEAEKYYDQFAKEGNDISRDPELLYYYAKSLFFGGKTDEAAGLFSSLQKDAEFYPQARYFLGVIALRDKKFEDARAIYEEILTLSEDAGYHNFKNIRELAELAVARIDFESGDMDSAFAHYAPVSLDSRSFPQAYYELSWTFIKRDQFDDAISSLRLLKNLAPYSRVATQAEILEGTLLVKMGRFGEAMVLFNSIVSRYSKYQDELFSIDGKAFMASGRSGKVSDFLLPYSPAVRSILEDSKKFSETVVLNDTIIDLEEELKRIEDIGKKVSTIAGNKNAAAIFPPLKVAVKTAMTLRNRIASVKNSLVMARNEYAGSSLSEAERGDFERLDSEKRSLLDVNETSSIPAARIRERAEEYGDKVVKLDEKMHGVSMELEALAARIDKLIASYSEDKNLEKENEKEFLDKIGQERENYNALSAENESCQAEIDDEKNGLVLGGTLIEAENAIRDSFNGILARQQGIIGNAPDTTDAFEVSALIGEADRIDARLAEFTDRLNDSMKGIISELRASYEQEKNNVDGYRSELMRAKREVEEMAVLALYSNMNTARNIFADLVLQGDLGLIDVAWEMKEESSSEIMRLKTRKANEIQQLNFNLDGEQ